jgi:hypothetical protein
MRDKMLDLRLRIILMGGQIPFHATLKPGVVGPLNIFGVFVVNAMCIGIKLVNK